MSASSCANALFKLFIASEAKQCNALGPILCPRETPQSLIKINRIIMIKSKRSKHHISQEQSDHYDRDYQHRTSAGNWDGVECSWQLNTSLWTEKKLRISGFQIQYLLFLRCDLVQLSFLLIACIANSCREKERFVVMKDKLMEKASEGNTMTLKHQKTCLTRCLYHMVFGHILDVDYKQGVIVVQIRSNHNKQSIPNIMTLA